MNNEDPVLFPKFLKKPTWRALALYKLGRLYTLAGDVYDITSMDELCQVIFPENLLVFVESLVSLPEDWLDLALAHGDIFCLKDGTPRALRIRGPRRTTRWIVSCDAWNQPLSLEFLADLADVFTLARVGTANTPGALGLALLKETWFQQFGASWREHRHQRPPESVCLHLKATCTGARSDLDPAYTTTLIPYLKELDLKNAYGANFGEEPSGPTIKFYGNDTGGFYTYYARCRVSLSSPLAYGLFPVRRETKGTAEIIYPTQPGEYQCDLWQEEVELLRTRGLLVEVQGGDGWRESTHDTAAVVTLLEQLRDSAPEHLKAYFKLALVALVGRMGMPSVSYTLTEEETPLRVAFDGRAFDLFVQEIVESRPESMPHWFYYTLMKCRLALTLEAEKWQAQEMLVGDNTDGVYLLPQADTTGYATQEHKAAQPSGTWILTEHTNVRLPAPRHFRSDQKITLPGIPRESQAMYLARLEEDVPY